MPWEAPHLHCTNVAVQQRYTPADLTWVSPDSRLSHAKFVWIDITFP
jgi:hypothetical protein